MIKFKKAIVRKPGKNFAQGLTTSPLGQPDYDLMIEQHANYARTLSSLGLNITELPVLKEFPDAYFVEDAAVVTDEIAVITNPGAEERRGEIEFIKESVSRFRKLAFIHPPGTLDGGDVLQVDKQFFVGISGRTNKFGAEQLSGILSIFGYTNELVEVGEGLHLKSGVNYIGDKTLLLTQQFSKLKQFSTYQKIILDEDETYSANSLMINNTLLIPKGFPKTKAKLEETQKNIIEVNVSEAQKMDGGLTCMSLRFS